MHAMPVMIVVLCLMAIAYRFYSAFLAAKVAVLDDLRVTPAEKFNDGQNYHPTNKWVLFGHHFAAISGSGPLIGPVLAAQFGYLPGLLWIVIGVCLGGAMQDFLVLCASMRRGGRSLAQIAFHDIGRVAGTAATDLLDRTPDPVIRRIVKSWPGRFETVRARALGLGSDASFEDVIREYVRENPDAVKLPLVA